MLKNGPAGGGGPILASAISRTGAHHIFLQRFVKGEAYLQPVPVKMDKLKDRVGKLAVKTERCLF